jgi:hypothetical protein
MKTIAHRGGIGKGMQNSPAGVRLAVRHQADGVELDVVRGAHGGFHCAHHGWNSKQIPVERVVFASHRTGVLRRARKLMPQVRLARFGLFAALFALWQQQPWECCMINQMVLTRWLVQALQQRGYEVIASCVWELRSRRSVKQLGVDGAFMNLYEGKTPPGVSAWK